MNRTAMAAAMTLLASGAAFSGEIFRLTTDKGKYDLQLTPHGTKTPLGALHQWHLVLTDPGGRPVDGATVHVDGGMPAHGHGLPTAPKVANVEGAGNYLIEGLRFNMPGEWELRLTIEGAAGIDTGRLVFGL